MLDLAFFFYIRILSRFLSPLPLPPRHADSTALLAVFRPPGAEAHVHRLGKLQITAARFPR